MSAVERRSSRLAWFSISIALMIVGSLILRRNGVVKRASAPPPAHSGAARKFAALPLYFELNQGQSDPQVHFLSHQGNYSVFLTDDAATFSIVGLQRQAATGKAAHAASRLVSAAMRVRLVGGAQHPRIEGRDSLRGRVNYLMGDDPSRWHREVPIFGSVAYHDVYPGIDLVYYGAANTLEYDLEVRPGADPSKIKFAIEGPVDSTLDDAGNIKVATTAGTFTIRKPAVYQLDSSGGRREIAGNYLLAPAAKTIDGVPSRGVRLALGDYDKTREVVIDPQLFYSTLIGGTATSNAQQPPIVGSAGGSVGGVTLNIADASFADAIDSAGDAYITGTAFSTDFPTKAALQPALAGANVAPGQNPNAFVAKFDPTMSGNNSLIYSTYLGGKGDTNVLDTGLGFGDYATGIAVDTSNDVYLAGYTYSADFPGRASCGSWGNATNQFNTNINNGFISVLNSTGSAVAYSCYIHGSQGAPATRVAINPTCSSPANCDVYASGWTTVTNAGGTDFPSTSGALFTKNPEQNGRSAGYIVVAPANGSAATTPKYASFYGGTGNANGGDAAQAIAVDSAGHAYMTGYSFSTDLPHTANAGQSVNNAANPSSSNGTTNAFVVEFDPAASGTPSLIYASYFGGKGIGNLNANPPQIFKGDIGTAITVDGGGHIFFAGSAFSTTGLFTSTNAFQSVNNAAANLGSNAFATEIDTSQLAGNAQFIYSTYFGGSGKLDPSGNFGLGDYATGIAIDGGGHVYIAGSSSSPNLPVSANACQKQRNGGVISNAFSAELNPAGVGAGQLVFSSYFGGDNAGLYGDTANDIKVDSVSGLAYMSGFTYTSNFPVTGSAFQSQNKAFAAGFTNGFLTVLDPTSAICPPPTPTPSPSPSATPTLTPTPSVTATNTPTLTPTATPTILPGTVGFNAPGVVVTAAPGATVTATFSAINGTPVTETINSVTITVSNTQVFSSLSLSSDSQSGGTISPVSSIGNTFLFSPGLSVGVNQTVNFTLTAVVSGGSAMITPHAAFAYAAIVPAGRQASGRGLMPLLGSLMLIGFGMMVFPASRRRRLAGAALVIVVLATGAAGCSGGGGGGSSGGGVKTLESTIDVSDADISPEGGAISNLPLEIADVTKH